MKLSMNVGSTPDDAAFVSLEADATVGEEAPSQARWTISSMKLGSKVIDVRVPKPDEAYLSFSDYGADETWFQAADTKELKLRDHIADPLGVVETIAGDLDSATYEGDDPWRSMPEGPRYRLTLPVGELGDLLAGVAEFIEVDLPETVDAYFWTDDEGRPVSLVFDPEDTLTEFSMRIDFSDYDKGFEVKVPPAADVVDAEDRDS